MKINYFFYLVVLIFFDSCISRKIAKEYDYQSNYNKTLDALKDTIVAIGPPQKKIAESVFEILYEYNDSIISKQQKLDILHLMIFKEEYTTRYYRSFIFSKIRAEEDLVFLNIEYILPLFFCHYCKETDHLCMIKERELIIDSLPKFYDSYYSELLKIISKVNCTNAIDLELQKDVYDLDFIFELKIKLYNKYNLDIWRN